MSEERRRGECWRERCRALASEGFFFSRLKKKKKTHRGKRRHLEPTQFSERLFATSTAVRSWTRLLNAKATAVVFIKSKFVCLSQLGVRQEVAPPPRNRRLCLPPPATSSGFRLFQRFHFFCLVSPPLSKSVCRRQAALRDSVAVRVPVLAEKGHV